MANRDQSMGLRPHGKILSAVEMEAAAAIYPGDMVKITDAGRVTPCAASNASVGVALSYASGAGQKVLIADSPDQKFVVQCDDATVAAQTNLNLNYNITVGTASTLYKRSAMELDASTGATDSTLPLRAIALQKAVDNAFGDQVDIIVKINNHQNGNKIEGL